MPSFIAYDGKRFAEKLDRYSTTIVTLQMHNLKKYFGILDYALRVFSNGFPLYEILLNISTLYQVSTRPTSNW